MAFDWWVYDAQVWLNGTYGHDPRYVLAPESGQTGWSTMFSLTRALQIELGITETSDSFGPTTLSRLTVQVGSVDASTVATKPNIIGILQAALWCKGYWGSAPFGAWDSDVADAVAGLRADMGLSAIASVPPKVFKSLLTMDAYILIGNGTAKVRDIQRWLNGRYFNRADFFICPCDGIYSRQVQQALLYAIQYEIGMADGVANGNFGPGTRQGIRDYGQISLGSSDGTRKMVSLFQAALIFNGHDATPFTGSFGTQTLAETAAFQAFVELPASGSGDFSTWASLLVSTGDVDRPVTAFDTATPLTSGTAALAYSNGLRYVGRYINGFDKRILPNEPALLWAQGLKWFAIYQEYNDSAEHFSEELGKEQGERIAARMRQLGIKPGTRVYLAVDFDATHDDIYAVVIPHFQKVAEALAAAPWGAHRLGVYGTRNVCATLASQSLTESSFVSDMSTGYSGNLGFKLPPNWAYDQIVTTTIASETTSLEIDRVVASSRAESIALSDVVATPRDYVSGEPAGRDEGFWWRLVSLQYLAARTGQDPLINATIQNDFILLWMQQPDYWSSAWQAVTPLPWVAMGAGPGSIMSAAYARFAAEAGTGLYSRPIDFGPRFGDTRHWAATSRGYTTWGPPASPSDIWIGDLTGWALDLVTAWNDYETARELTANGALDVRTWIAANVGVNDAMSFGRRDLKADMAAFMYAKLVPGRSLEDVAREMLIAVEQDPGWLAKAFYAERFGSRANIVAAVERVFTTDWTSPAPWGRSMFLEKRPPGADSTISNPPASIRSTELTALGNGFADALEAAKTWSDR